MKDSCFFPADICLPDFKKVDGKRWAVIACDQFTSEKDYWEAAERTVGDAPSTLRMVLPEVYLSEAASRLPQINQTMEVYERELLLTHPDAMLYLERTQDDGAVRRGIIGCVDLSSYSYTKGAESPIRATEGTVLERIPPRVAIRRDAALELPHVMLLIDDPEKTVIEPLLQKKADLAPAYDFDLMLGGGHVTAYFLSEGEKARVGESLLSLVTPDKMEARYGSRDIAPLLFAVGDGNHSLASAKAMYEEVKARIGEEAAKNHPARYALCEVVNLHDEALKFEPIYRVVFGVEPEQLLSELSAYIDAQSGGEEKQPFTAVYGDTRIEMAFLHPDMQLTVGSLQAFLDGYIAKNPDVTVDYIHDEASVLALTKDKKATGFLFDGIRKDQLFKTVIYDGVLPRKTFSMGNARGKRYYLECRKIKK